MFDPEKYLTCLRDGDYTVNPFLSFMDIRCEEIGHGYARFCMPVKPEFLQGAGWVQGGILVALADEAIAHAIMTVLEKNEGLTTVSLKSDFLKSVSSGSLIAEASIFRKGKTIVLADCFVRNDLGHDILRCAETFLIMRSK